MGMRYLFILLLFQGTSLIAQKCTTLGQTPGTAFPVCGVDVFKQSSVPLCSTHPLTVPGCPDQAAQGGYTDKNPFWYQFTCYVSGSLGFIITPNRLLDDYDWQLYDITGRNPDAVFTDKSLVVTGNWSGSSGLTGASANGLPFLQCASRPQDNASTFANMPQIKQGHTYLLLISHYTNDQSGYQLSFGGGTGSITDPNIPKLFKASIACDGEHITIRTSKKVRCNSLSQDGSDFSISASAHIISASGVNCGNSFDMDSILLTTDQPLAPGNYTITAKIGEDGNTLLDDCNNTVETGNNVSFDVFPGVPTPIDSIAPVGCAPTVLQLVFRKPIHCNSISADGSDFVVTGPSAVTVQSASGNCANNLTDVVLIHLSAPIVAGGLYQIQLRAGSDGNTIVDACNQQTQAGATINFSTKDTVWAAFDYQVLFGCRADTIQFKGGTANGINAWSWTFDGSSSSIREPVIIYSDFGAKAMQLVVSNGVCSDTANTSVLLDNTLKAVFTAPDNVCPTDKVVFQNNSIGKNINSWNWNFGDGVSGTEQMPLPHSYPPSADEMKYTVQLVVGNTDGCYDTSAVVITKVRSCYITVPTAFTPNGDGKNDFLYPLNAYKATNLEFQVYNRYGQLVFETRDWTKKWDGTINGKPQDLGTYAWMLQYTDSETGKKVLLKGTTVLVR